jgi:GT2 family glycosyltransferase/glycosyltransferase involved in cell wall biosynthesis
MISYHHPKNTKLSRIGNRPVISTEQDGKIAVDLQLGYLWEFANEKDLGTILKEFKPGQHEPDEIRAGLACLAEAGLLKREPVVEPDDSAPPGVATSQVSVIIVAHNSLEWLPDCFSSISNQTHNPIEIIIVDNASNDGTQDWIASNYPDVTYQQLNELASFAKAINLGVDASAGEYLLLLNPDTVLDGRAIAQMLDQAEVHSKCGAVAAKLKFLWAPGFLNGIGNRVDKFSWGVDNALGCLDLGQFDGWNELPSACFAAVLIPREIWTVVGPADEMFPMYYEDSEWSYRARMQGYSIIAAPQSIVYHAFGGRIPGPGSDRLNPTKLENVVYGRLRFTTKLLDGYLEEYFLSYITTDFINFFRYLISLKFSFAAAILQGYRKFFKDFSDIRSQRKVVSSKKVVKDKAIFRLQRAMPETSIWQGLPELTWDLVRSFYLPEITKGNTRRLEEFSPQNRQPKLLIVSHDVIDEKLAGPGMRYLELGRTLSKDINVTIAVPRESSVEISPVEIQRYNNDNPGSLKQLVDGSDIVLVSSYLVDRFPFLEKSKARIVIDLYDPFVLENLHYYLDEPLESQEALNRQSVAFTNQLARVGDFFICGNERQRDFWLGVLTSNGRINPRNYSADPQFRKLIDVVGIGYPDKPPEVSTLLRGAHPSIPADAQIVLWGGGIWNWLDPITLINAWISVIKQFPKARLVFLGTRHPNPDIPAHKMAEDAQSLADDIGEREKSIIFIEWLSYADREALLSEADIGVSLHPIHIETRYSIRTRILDYIWARLPILSTEGDITSEWIRDFGLGRVVEPHDAAAVEKALTTMLKRSKDSWKGQFDSFGDANKWEHIAAPLQQYCLEGGYAADRLEREKLTAGVIETRGTPGLNWARARFIYRSEGFGGLTHRTWRYIQRRIVRH